MQEWLPGRYALLRTIHPSSDVLLRPMCYWPDSPVHPIMVPINASARQPAVAVISVPSSIRLRDGGEVQV